MLDYLLQYLLGGIAQVNRGVAANPRRSYYHVLHQALQDDPEWGNNADLHSTNSLWQFLTLFDSHKFSSEKNYKGLTVIICGCPLCFSPSVRVFCVLSQFHNHAELLLGREGGPREKAHSPGAREDIALLFVSLYLQTWMAPLPRTSIISPLSQGNKRNSPPGKRLA